MSSPTKPLPAYVYACVDRSVLVQPFCRIVVARFANRMPVRVPANFLTLGSSLCVGLMLVSAGRLHPAFAAAPWCAALMFGYIIYDHADGMHARRTGTSGPLGEYLDHYLDAFNGPIAVVTMFLIAAQQTSGFLLPVVCAVAVASASTMLEQRETRILYFGLVGPLEGMLLTLVFLLSWCVPSAASFWFASTPWAGTWFSTLVWAGLVGSIITSLASLVRIGRIPLSFGLDVLLTGTLAWTTAQITTAWWSPLLVVSLYGSDYIGRMLASHLRGTVRPWPDLLAPAVALIGLAVHGHGAGWTWGIGGYLAARNVVATTANFYAFRRGWRWSNPSDFALSPLP